MIARLLDCGPQVLATGGGIVTSPDTFALLRRSAVTIWLRARAKDHWNRVVRQGDRRPMANHPQAMADLRALLATSFKVKPENVALGAGSEDATALAERLQGWLANRGRTAGQTLAAFRAATASYPSDGTTIDDLLDVLGRSLSRGEEASAAQQAVG